MSQVLSFGEVVEAADRLSQEEQAELIAILRRRLAEAARARIVASALEAQREFAAGQFRPMTPAEIVREAQS